MGTSTPGSVTPFLHPPGPQVLPNVPHPMHLQTHSRVKNLRGEASCFRLTETICHAKGPHGTDSMPQCVVICYISAPSIPHYHPGPTNALHPGAAVRWPDSGPVMTCQGGSQPRNPSPPVTLLLPGPEGHEEGGTSLPKVRLTLPLLISGLPVTKGRDAAPRDQRMVTLLSPTIAKPL